MYRIRDIEEWLEESGVRTKIARGRAPNVPVEHVTLIPTPGRGLEAEGATTIAGLQVRCRHQNFDAAEALAQQVDEILVPLSPLDDHNGIWIGKDEKHMTHILSTARRGGEPSLTAVDDRFFEFTANYEIRAVRESATIEEVRASA